MLSKDTMKKIQKRYKRILTDNYKFDIATKPCVKYIKDNNLHIECVIYNFIETYIHDDLGILPIEYVDAKDNIYIKPCSLGFGIDYVVGIKHCIGLWIDVLNGKVVTDETTINLLNMMI